MSDLSAHESAPPTDGLAALPARIGAGPQPATDLANALRDHLLSYVEQRKADAAGAVSDVAEALRVGAANLDGFPVLKTACGRIAREVDGLADGIAGHTAGEIAHAVGAAVRRRPGIAAAVAVTAAATAFYLVRRPGMRWLMRQAVTAPDHSAPGAEA